MILSNKKDNTPDKIVTISAPKYVHLTITNSCNWNCVFCSVHTKKLDYYNLNTIKKVLDNISEAGVVDVNLYGGEPTLHPDFIEIGRYAKNLGLYIGFLSNGAQIKNNNIDKITDIFDMGTISIHGFKKLHEQITNTKGAYNCAIDAITLLDDSGFKYGLATTVSTQNLFEFPSLIKYLYFKYPSARAFVVNRASYTGCGEEFCLNKGEILELVSQIDKLYKEYKLPIKLGVPTPPELLPLELRKYSSFCSSGTDFGNISGNGDVKMCYSLAKSPILGNILKQPLSEIWNSDYLQKYRSFDWIDKKCKSCNWFYNCFCGCKRQINGEYGVDSIVHSNYNEYFVLEKNTKKRLINGIVCYSTLGAPTILVDDIRYRNIIDLLITPKTKSNLNMFAKKQKVSADQLSDLLQKLLASKLIKKVYRPNMAVYNL